MSRQSSTSASGLTMSSTLWAHLLNKDTTVPGPGLKTGLAAVEPAMSAPADRAGTSVRILLHDTQATIEKFSERVDKLVSEAENSRQKLLARNEEVNEEVERLVRRVIQEQVGRTETTLQSCIREPAQASALAELRQSISSSLDALNQKVDAVQTLAHINTQALQTIKDQQLQILSAIIPLLPMLQKIPLHIAATEANLKEAIRGSAVGPISSTRPPSTGSTADSRKRKLSKNADQHSPSPSVTKRKRIRIDSSCAAQQLPSPKSSRDSFPTEGAFPTTNHHRTVGDALQFGARSASRSINTAQTPNPGQRSSMQPPIIVPTTPSRTRSVSLSERSAQHTSALSHKKANPVDTSVTPLFVRPVPSAHSATSVPANHLNPSRDASKVPSQFHIHTPLRTGSRYPNGQSTKPSALPPSSVGFSARRGKRFIPVTDEDDDEISDG